MKMEIISHKVIEEYNEILSQMPEVSNILEEVTGDIYSILFNFSCSKGIYPLRMVFLDSDYPHIFSDKDIKGLPHVGRPFIGLKFRSLCLFNSEIIVGNGKSVKDKIDFIFERLNKLFTMSEIKKKQEYKKEFLYYWEEASSNEDEYFTFINKYSTNFNVETFYIRDKKYYTISDVDKVFNTGWDYLKKEKISTPCLRVNFELSKIPLPPINQPWSNDYFLEVIDNILPYEKVLLDGIAIPSNEVYIIFSFKYPGILPLDLLLRVEFNSKIKNKSFLEKKKSIKKIHHISVSNSSLEKTFERIGSTFKSKKTLVIGCGSLGSYIIDELPNMGFDDITLLDYDKLEAGNIFRHKLNFLDLFDSDLKKANLMSRKLMRKHPEIKTLAYDDLFNFRDFKDEYDLIIINTGDIDTQLCFNKYFKKIKVKSPVLFNWIEYDGVGVHSLYVDYSKSGCFQCLYENGNRNKMHFYKGKIKLPSTGCGGVFNPYGNEVLMKGSAMVISIINRIFNDKIDENYLFSIKLKNKDINKSDLSKRYDESIEKLEEGTLGYKDINCEVCSHEKAYTS